MNTSAQFGGLVGALAFGYIVERFHSYDAPFVPMVGLLLVGAVSWLSVDATETLKEVTGDAVTGDWKSGKRKANAETRRAW